MTIDITPFLQFQNQLKVLHWNAKSKSHHETLGSAYEQFDDKIDEFVEVVMGSSRNSKYVCSDVPFDYPENNGDDYAAFGTAFNQFYGDIKSYADDDSGLQSLLDDMKNIAHRTTYLLKMS